MITSQKGAGLMEVLVALLLLSVAVLGFIALQIRAVAASTEAGQNIQATNIARDLAERIRVNRTGLSSYVDIGGTDTLTDCSTTFCDATQMAKYDYVQVKQHATDLGMSLAILNCKGFSLNRTRQCIYVAWGGTTATDGNGSPNCTNGTAYVPDAKCTIMEVYNYD
ncbi:TPA: type IV pilus modification protein PilV [Acinetobacter nosocomialis]|uniref:type IV pilus modification protein PilV n=1 Tax=Acinetobacter TaxID=469 RepID=UPI00028E3202|nr:MULTISPECIES: type IV pilus modification protein PilV [Acinetobacter]EKF46373.1 type IV pilus modification protein PilV [Acinetobacter nosocomialis Ab22222]EXS43679.1 type IV pilus modification protein PilV [Acinetobacter sp. 88816]MBP1505374.1 type IV pilus modification protein PilV [Acinetobacter nosocomialis]MBR7698298.1 type IV pilus modification protein PilV [Acinetobacter nosocomialis]MBU3115488.1 type IV pilus modification protein PilV [Acinetobacter nosocomialis]